MAIWVGKQKMACRSCIKGHRSSTCNHIGGPLWAVRPAGRPNKACIHGPGDLCLCAHYFPLTWLKAAVPRNKKCSCQGHGSAGGRTCSCSANSNGASKNAAESPAVEDDTQPIFYQELVARGLQVTTEPIDLDVPAASAPPPPATSSGSCCSVSAPKPTPPITGGSCCSGSGAMSTPIPAPVPETTTQSSCCSKSESTTPTTANGYIKTESMSTPGPFAPIPQFASAAALPPHFPVMKFPPANNGTTASAVDHVCECGPTCNCVLCIDHPYNTATMHHIATEFGQMMNTDPPQQLSPTTTNINGATNDFFWGANGMMPPGFNDSSFWESYTQQQRQQQQQQHQHHQSHSPPPHATDMDIILNPEDFQMFNFAFPPMDENVAGNGDRGGQQQHQQQQGQFDVSMGGTGNGMEPMMGADLLDMSGFCGGAAVVCPCGDDCACIGCQIHKPTGPDGLENGNGITAGVRTPSWG